MVVARRYRPQSFDDLVGQSQVSQALSNAIQTHRVGHAYLFTGARGVGKTSTARIFAKALNCVRGPTPTPCNECDICQGVTQGGDVDVLEIDGASNRGIEEIRQLRANLNVRPSRARFKIYIIDEVHMLTTAAFNALLKTLEEPPEHVKFIFCTTDPEKIPITVLSRCQRFDFPPVESASIMGRLEQILANEGWEADDEALRLLARRAAGSMRDSQSLLEQLLASATGRITVADVHRMLGTAGSGRVTRLARLLCERQAAAALSELEAALHESIDQGQLAEQLLAYFRDLLAVAVGCGPDLLLQAAASEHGELRELAAGVGLETLLAALQILDQAVTKMRHSPHARVLLEMAIVRICRLENLEELAQLAARLQAGGPLPTTTPTRSSPPLAAENRADEGPSGNTVAGNTVAGEKKKPAELNELPEPGSPATAVSLATTTKPATSPSLTTSSSGRYTPAGGEFSGQGGGVEVAARESPPASGAAGGFASSSVARSSVSRSAGLDEVEVGPAEPPVTAGVAVDDAAADVPRLALQSGTARQVWEAALDLLEDMTADFGRFAAGLAVPAPDRLVVSFRPEYTLQKQSCERPDRRSKIEQALARVVGRMVKVEFELLPGEAKGPERRAAPVSRVLRIREREKHPLVQQAKALFDAEIVDVVEPRGEGT
ncbi:MAG: DNA polymerase III subunit gamma/tau [Pirellulales bacterium]